jgi:glycosyltransferase involved in cell wall biosynthesis
MIILCELSFLGRAHVPFNAGLLATIHAAFPKEDLWFYGSSAHIEELKKEVSQTLAGSIIWTEINPPPSDATYLKRFVRELKIVWRLLGSLTKDSKARLVLTSAYPSTVLAVKIGDNFRRRRVSVQIVLHGLSGVVGKRFRHPIRRFQDMKTALALFGNHNIRYIVLESPIRDTVIENFPLLAGKIDTLEHPLSPSQTELPAMKLASPIRFGFLGLADKAKGFPVFVDVANHITARYGKGVEFHAIGHWPVNNVPTLNGIEVLATRPGGKLMSRADFVQSLSSLHFVVLPHEAGAYILTASGVLLDAIALGKPVIARRIPIFEAFFEKHGDVGYLFSDNESLKEIVEGVLQEADTARYHCQVLNLRAARKSRDPEILAASFRESSRKLGLSQI